MAYPVEGRLQGWRLFSAPLNRVAGLVEGGDAVAGVVAGVVADVVAVMHSWDIGVLGMASHGEMLA